jgi:hypothetical protein
VNNSFANVSINEEVPQESQPILRSKGILVVGNTKKDLLNAKSQKFILRREPSYGSI